MDAGEDPRRAAERECTEETGLQVQAGGLLDFVTRPASSMGAHLILYFCVTPVSGVLRAGDDAQETGYFSLDSLPELAFETHEHVRQLAARC